MILCVPCLRRCSEGPMVSDPLKQAVVSCLMLVLGTKLMSSAGAPSAFTPEPSLQHEAAL